MTARQCYGCGRPLGLRAEAECPCWLSHRDTALIPERLQTRTKRYRSLREQPRRGAKKR